LQAFSESCGIRIRSIAVEACRFDIGVQVIFQPVVTGHFVAVAVFFVEAQPPALYLNSADPL